MSDDRIPQYILAASKDKAIQDVGLYDDPRQVYTLGATIGVFLVLADWIESDKAKDARIERLKAEKERQHMAIVDSRTENKRLRDSNRELRERIQSVAFKDDWKFESFGNDPISEWVSEYAMICESDNEYNPTDFERCLIVDALRGYESEQDKDVQLLRTQAIADAAEMQRLQAQIDALKAQRDALLAALEWLVEAIEFTPLSIRALTNLAVARKAIAKAQGGQP
ncbi:MAG: hypothetical protein VXW65_05430 [Pseudomonadota bacterium]|nr:hypothetical protein [Pseudomonadota bacterium]